LRSVEISFKRKPDREAWSRMDAFEPPNQKPRNERMFNAPGVVVALALVLVVVYATFSWANPTIQDLIIRDFAFVPGRLTISYWPARAIDLLIRANTDPRALEQARQMRSLHALGGGPKPWTLLTYAFLHGSWTHVMLNTVWLMAFGPPVARRFRATRFLLFMAVTAILSALAQWVCGPMDFTPLIGVSGAVSGLMGAVTRFMFQPGAPLGPSGFMGMAEVENVPAASLRGLLVDSRALIFVGIWLATNLIFGAFARTLGFSDMPVAWIAHLGGFFGGLFLFSLFDRPPRLTVAPRD
jgi:membrane associated rhomboid family serine protease